MKVITKYEAADGSQFNDALACEKYEKLCHDVAQFMALIPKRPDNIEYCNGKGFIQHDPAAFDRMKQGLLDCVGTQIDHVWIAACKRGECHISYVARLVDDYGISCLNHAMHRIYCTDDALREWGQPFYALNPGKGENIKLNP